MSSKNKVTALLKGFQEDRRTKRRETLLRMFVELHDEFDSLVPTITADISNILSLAHICHHVDREAFWFSRTSALRCIRLSRYT